MLGILVSLVFISVFRELQPYRSSVNNYIAASAQVAPTAADQAAHLPMAPAN